MHKTQKKEGADSGALLVAPDPDAPVTVPGVAPDDDAGEGESIRPSVQGNAVLLGKVFAPRFGVSVGPVGHGRIG